MHRAARVGTWVGGGVVVLAMSKVHARYIADPPYDFTGSSRFAWAIGYVVLIGVATYSLGLPDVPRNGRDAVARSIGATLIAALGVSAVQLVVGDALLPRFVVFGSVLVAALVLWGLSMVSIAGRSRGEARDRVLLVAEPDEQARLVDDLDLDLERPVVLAAALTAAAAAQENGLVDALDRCAATLVVLDLRAQADPAVVAQAARLHEAGIRVRSVHDFYEQWLGKLPLSELARTSLFFDISEVHGSSFYAQVKRLMDIAVAAVGLIALILVTPVVLVGNVLGNRGPLLYRQRRVGKGGAVFTILKFRTMTDATASSPEAAAPSSWTQRDDPRVTTFGRFLRSSHLDELPQVVNIAQGDLSVVGPRPEQPHYVEELSSALAFYDMRHLVRPGLTGWAQVKYGYGGDEKDALQKLQYEFYYLRHQNLGLDLRTIARTFRSLAGGSGAGR